MDPKVLSRAEAAFKRDAEAAVARKEYDELQAAINANMVRLREERLAREAREGKPKPKKKRARHS